MGPHPFPEPSRSKNRIDGTPVPSDLRMGRGSSVYESGPIMIPRLKKIENYNRFQSARRATSMGIKDWRGGKIALIWVIAPIVILVLVATAVFTTPFVLTWKWLSGKESKPKS